MNMLHGTRAAGLLSHSSLRNPSRLRFGLCGDHRPGEIKRSLLNVCHAMEQLLLTIQLMNFQQVFTVEVKPRRGGGTLSKTFLTFNIFVCQSITFPLVKYVIWVQQSVNSRRIADQRKF